MHTQFNMYGYYLGYKITAGGGSKTAIVSRIIAQTKRTFHNKNHLLTKKISRLHMWNVALNMAEKQKRTGKVETFGIQIYQKMLKIKIDKKKNSV